MKLYLILNPAAGKNKGEQALQQAISLLEARKIQTEVVTSNYAGHVPDLTQQFDASKYDGIIAVGGDGTLFELINGLLKKHKNFDTPIGQIPVGTGNSFIKDLEIHSIEDAVEKIAAGKTQKIDVAFFKYPEGGYYFINLLGTGFVANVARRANKYKSLGSLSYVIGVFEEVVKLKSCPVELTVDGKVYQRDYIFVEICNSTRTGGDMIMAPDARIDDGLLDVILLKDISRFNLIRIFPQIFKGTHVNDSHVEVFRGKHIKVATEQPQLLSPDGEIFGSTPIEVSILPQKLNLFC